MKDTLFTFDDVLIVPQFSTIGSRKDVSTASLHVALPGLTLPIISANMDTVTDSKMAKAMAKAGGIGCLHRFCTIEENVNMLYDSFIDGLPMPIVSIGLGDSELERAEALYNAGASHFVIDVAHGAQLSVVNQVKKLRNLLGYTCKIMVGNFASAQSVKDFLDRTNEIDSIKIGVGPGSSCETRVKTGIGYPQLSAIMEIAELLKNTNIAIIADGGMKTPGDICKALAAGAHAVMLGGMLAGTDETPGEIYKEWYEVSKEELNKNVEWKTEYGTYPLPDRYYIATSKSKKYRGSASKESYESQGKNDSHRTTEGESFLVPYKGPVKNILQDIEGGLRSSMCYVGAKNLDEFRKKATFVRVTNATAIEGTAHGKGRKSK